MARNPKKRRSRNLKELPVSVRTAIKTVLSHPAVDKGTLKGPFFSKKKFIRIEILFKVKLPSKSRASGVSKTGVKNRETVIIDFPPTFPYQAPTFLLRKDFNQELPHINPSKKGDHVSPCIYAGDISELMHRENGIYALLDQLSEWLCNAAGNTLINMKQGWEPIRRDNINGFIAYDINDLRKHITTTENYIAFATNFRFSNYLIFGHVMKKTLTRSIKYIGENVRTQIFDNILRGEAAGIMVWSDEKSEDGKKIICNKYLPDNIDNLEDLLSRSESYGCRKNLWSTLQETFVILRQNKSNNSLLIVVIICVRRPVQLINDDSSIELIPYIVLCNIKNELLGGLDTSSPVIPVSHRHVVSSTLLQQMSGASRPKKEGHIVQLGCGSLGSKIAVHLSRAGHGPFILADNKAFSPHNTARHALFKFQGSALWQNKAEMLKGVLKEFPQAAPSEIITSNIIDHIINRQKKKENIFPEDTNLIIDSTASFSVREILSTLKPEESKPPLMHTSLYSHGRYGVIIVEGINKNPRIDDLIYKIYDCAIDNKKLADLLKDTVSRQEVGQGCGSDTIIMPDTIVSFYSSAMAERARQIIEEGAPSKGELNIGFLSEDKLGIKWIKHDIHKTYIMPRKKESDWEIRILGTATDDIVAESVKYSGIETGGILMGKFSFARRCLIITRVLDAPSDSKRSQYSFVLGTNGLREMIRKTQEASGNLITYIGTWHSHPASTGPSDKDHYVLKKMKELRLGAPSICLIHTSGGFHYLIDEGD